MFEARLINGALLKRIIESIKDLVNDINLDVTPLGVSFQAMDTSHVALVAFFMSAAVFDHFRASTRMVLGLNTAKMAKILKLAGANDIITLKADGSKDLQLLFESPRQTNLGKFSMKLLDLEVEQLGIPDTEYACALNLPSAEFKSTIHQLSDMGDTGTIAFLKDTVTFSVPGDNINANVKYRTSIPDEKDGKDFVSVRCQAPMTQTFAIRYLNFFTKGTALADRVTVRASPDVPLVVEYKLGESNEGYLRFYLAPKAMEEAENAPA